MCGSGWRTAFISGKGERAPSNAAQVAKIRRILEEPSLDIATPEEAREMLASKGAHQVAFQGRFHVHRPDRQEQVASLQRLARLDRRKPCHRESLAKLMF